MPTVDAGPLIIAHDPGPAGPPHSLEIRGQFTDFAGFLGRDRTAKSGTCPLISLLPSRAKLAPTRGVHLHRQVCDRLRHRDVVALRERDADLTEALEYLAGLDALRNRADIERFRHARDRVDDAFVGRILGDVANELAVDLHIVDGQVLQIGT